MYNYDEVSAEETRNIQRGKSRNIFDLRSVAMVPNAKHFVYFLRFFFYWKMYSNLNLMLYTQDGFSRQSEKYFWNAIWW